MNYKQEMDALRASDDLKARIATLKAPKKHYGKRIAAIAAAVVVVLFAGAITAPLFGNAGKTFDKAESMVDNLAPAEDGAWDYVSDIGATGDTEDVNLTAESQSVAQAINLPANRKLIRKAELYVQTKTFDAFCDAVSAKVGELSGYIESSTVYGDVGDTRSATVVARIPADSLDTFLQNVSALGTVTRQSTDIQDVTNEYIDIQSRIQALETEQETLLGLLKKAESLTDVLEIQGRLSEVRSTLEAYKAQMKALEGQINYSTVTMEISEVERIVAVERTSFFGQVRQNLSENFYAIGQGARSVALWFLSSLPYLLVLAVAAAVIALVIWTIVRKKRR